MIAVIDFGMGNLQSVTKGLENAGADIELLTSPASLKDADGIVLPGVGAFEAGMNNLRKLGFLDTIHESIDNEIPFLGICLGMQLLFTESEEHGTHKGIDIIPGRVIRFTDTDLKIPHMGWNQVDFVKPSSLCEGIKESPYYYFVHSFYCVPDNEDHILGRTEYGVPFCSAVEKDNVFGTQFHPEKSQAVGLNILQNFVKYVSSKA
ncbi:imidazole glycerol phosphate synthase subunit HisH [Planctomycetota bacterium]